MSNLEGNEADYAYADNLGNIKEADDLEDDSGNLVTTEAGNRVEGATARAVLDYIVESLADDPDAISIETERGRVTRFRVHVGPGDMGRMIGRRGRVARAIRTVVRVAGSRDGIETNVDFVDA